MSQMSAKDLVDQIITETPELAIEGLENFSGYYAKWDEVLASCQRAWKSPRGYAESPLELIAQIINERDEALATVKSYDRQDELIGTEFEGVDHVTDVIRILKQERDEARAALASST